MHVVVLQRVDAWGCSERDQVERVERPQAREIEDRAEVDEERIVTLAREHLPASRDVGDRRTRQRFVVRRRARADVVRRDRSVRKKRHRLARVAVRLELDQRQVVVLRPVPVRAVERRDRPGVVEERVRVPRDRVEPELVAQVIPAVPVVVDLDLVENRVVERREVRPAGGLFERDEVRDHRDSVRVVRAHERVQVGVVGSRVLADQRRLRVAGRLGRARSGSAGQDHHECQRSECEHGGDGDRFADTWYRFLHGLDASSPGCCRAWFAAGPRTVRRLSRCGCRPGPRLPRPARRVR